MPIESVSHITQDFQLLWFNFSLSRAEIYSAEVKNQLGCYSNHIAIKQAGTL